MVTPPEDPVTAVAAQPDDLVDVALDLLAVDTQNPPGETVEAVEWLEAEFGALGVPTERFAVDPAKPNLLATIPGTSDRVLCLNGHLDTVPVDADEWSQEPLGERVPGAGGRGDAAERAGASDPGRDDRIYGRGAADMKGALAAMVSVARAYVETGATPSVTLLFAFVSDEEVGGDAGLPALLDAGKLDADACVIGEPTGEPTRPSVAIADRGSIWLTMEAEGVAAHGSRPMLGTNAIDRLYAGITTLRERFGTRPLVVAPAVESIVAESIEYYAPTFGEDPARSLFAYPTINLGTIEGGEAINSVPASARAEIDVRLSPGVDTQDVLSAIRECATECEGVSLTDVSWSVGSYDPPGEPIVEAVARTAATVTGERVYRRSATGGGDAKKLRRAGIPTVEFAIAADTAHAVDEYTTVGALVDTARTYAALPSAFAERTA